MNLNYRNGKKNKFICTCQEMSCLKKNGVQNDENKSGLMRGRDFLMNTICKCKPAYFQVGSLSTECFESEGTVIIKAPV